MGWCLGSGGLTGTLLQTLVPGLNPPVTHAETLEEWGRPPTGELGPSPVAPRLSHQCPTDPAGGEGLHGPHFVDARSPPNRGLRAVPAASPRLGRAGRRAAAPCRPSAAAPASSPSARSAASLSNLINSPQGDPLPPAAGEQSCPGTQEGTGCSRGTPSLQPAAEHPHTATGLAPTGMQDLPLGTARPVTPPESTSDPHMHPSPPVAAWGARPPTPARRFRRRSAFPRNP